MGWCVAEDEQQYVPSTTEPGDRTDGAKSQDESSAATTGESDASAVEEDDAFYGIMGWEGAAFGAAVDAEAAEEPVGDAPTAHPLDADEPSAPSSQMTSSERVLMLLLCSLAVFFAATQHMETRCQRRMLLVVSRTEHAHVASWLFGGVDAAPNVTHCNPAAMAISDKDWLAAETLLMSCVGSDELLSLEWNLLVGGPEEPPYLTGLYRP